MRDRLRSNQPLVLILADFSDGSWHATSFAMQFLYKGKSPISILQTYQNPGWGHFMMRKLSHHLKEITKNELKALKNKLVTNFKIEKQEIKTLSVEGELNSILNYKPIINGSYNIVLCTYSSFYDSCTRQNRCLEKIINTSSHPLFILPKTFEGETTKKLLFVGNPDKIPSEQLSEQIKEICEKTQSNLELLFVVKNKNKKINEDVQLYYNEHFKGIELTINTIQNKTKCKGINEYIKNRSRDLIVIEND
jgi:hypothetical protein